MRRSAGILPYKLNDNDIYVYLEHPGGPYYKNVERYSICKGEYDKKENAHDAAIREFKEESGFDLSGKEILYLTSHKISNTKLVTMFIINIDLDPTKMKSNTFKKTFSTGETKEFPEMDKACWFKISEAKEVILKNQIFFLERLEHLIRMRDFANEQRK